MPHKELTIAFIGFDGYSDLWKDCTTLFNRYWQDCPYEVLFINNEKNFEAKGFNVFHAGKDAEWSRKVQLAIQNCRSKYLCLLLEDFFVGSKIDTEKISDTIEFIDSNSIKYYKLSNMSRSVKNHDPSFGGLGYLHVIPQSDEYGISLQPAIWEIDFLTKMLGKDNYNAWCFEFARVKEANGKPNTPHQGCVFDERNILNLKHGVVQSKYIPTTIKYFNSIGYALNIQRDVLSYIQYYRIRVISFLKYSMPKSFRKPVKKMMEILGMRFVSTERNQK